MLGANLAPVSRAPGPQASWGFGPRVRMAQDGVCLLFLSKCPGTALLTTHWATETTEICALPVLEARSPRSRCHRTMLTLKATGKGFSCLFQLLGAPGIPWLVGISPQSLPPTSHVFFHVSVSKSGEGGKIPVCIGPILIQHNPILTTNFIYKDPVS